MVSYDASVYPRLGTAEQQVFGLSLYMAQGLLPAGVCRPRGVPVDQDCAGDPEVLAYFLDVPMKAVEKVWAILQEKGAVRDV